MEEMIGAFGFKGMIYEWFYIKALSGMVLELILIQQLDD